MEDTQKTYRGEGGLRIIDDTVKCNMGLNKVSRCDIGEANLEIVTDSRLSEYLLPNYLSAQGGLPHVM